MGPLSRLFSGAHGERMCASNDNDRKSHSVVKKARKSLPPSFGLVLRGSEGRLVVDACVDVGATGGLENELGGVLLSLSDST